MRIWIGKYIAGVGILHCVFGLVVFRGVFAGLIRDGVINTVNVIDTVHRRPDRGYAFWFVDIGLFWILLGAVLDHYERAGHGLPRFLGQALGALAIIGVVVMPISGWWLFFIPAAALVFRSKDGGTVAPSGSGS